MLCMNMCHHGNARRQRRTSGTSRTHQPHRLTVSEIDFYLFYSVDICIGTQGFRQNARHFIAITILLISAKHSAKGNYETDQWYKLGFVTAATTAAIYSWWKVNLLSKKIHFDTWWDKYVTIVTQVLFCDTGITLWHKCFFVTQVLFCDTQKLKRMQSECLYVYLLIFRETMIHRL